MFVYDFLSDVILFPKRSNQPGGLKGEDLLPNQRLVATKEKSQFHFSLGKNEMTEDVQ
jgi:hypothetical protein